MLEIILKQDAGRASIEVGLNRHGFHPFRAEIFSFEFVKNGRVDIKTWDNRALQVIGSPETLYRTTWQAFCESDLLGVALPSDGRFGDQAGFLKLVNCPDEWPTKNTIQIIRIEEQSELATVNYRVVFQGKNIGVLSNMAYGRCDGEVRELCIAALELFTKEVKTRSEAVLDEECR